jgi:TetR/AcrR family transcriptional regulator, repressor of fatR-cypB operon
MSRSGKRSEIVRAGLELIVEHGFQGATMAMIAARAGVAAGTSYLYFESKDVLIKELYREIEEKIRAFLQEGYSTEIPFREQFLHIGTKLLQYCIDNHLDFRYLEQFHNSPYGVDCRRDVILGETENKDIFKNFFMQGRDQQVIRNLPLVVLFALAFGPLLLVARDHILGFIELDDSLIEQIVTACWDSLKR